MRDLIARLKAATGLDRELDAAIWRRIEPVVTDPEHGLDRKPWLYLGKGQWFDTSEPEARNVVAAPRYTSSFEAALTLVPEGAGIDLMRYWIAAVDGPVWSAVVRTGLLGESNCAEDRPTAAIALCIAALKARDTDHAQNETSAPQPQGSAE